jgi:hypothetical protein
LFVAYVALTIMFVYGIRRLVLDNNAM